MNLFHLFCTFCSAFHMKIAFLLCVTARALFAGLASAGENNCTAGKACQPWNGDKPCSSNQNIDFRLGVVDPKTGNMSAVGFCPVVDTPQMFNLTGMASLLHGEGAGSDLNLIVYGQGIGKDRTGNNSNSVLYATTDKCHDGSVAVAKYLVVTMTMKAGLYAYESDLSNPTNTGFAYTCKEDQCLLASDAVCIGPEGKKNCAECVKKDSLARFQTTVWATYNGTAHENFPFISDSYNPVYFHRFSFDVPQMP
uniref:Uncharacterized protein n=1 Tax=Trypanosoma congolense (strain IL3000) TaxID=1068625 RepID=G0UP04_TRYCI|nr:conserved hypothetical protein [Trypanosoma congolense IL3000]